MTTTDNVPINSDLGIFLQRADHFKYLTPTKAQRDTFLSNVSRFQKQKMTRDEAINLAFSITHWSKSS